MEKTFNNETFNIKKQVGSELVDMTVEVEYEEVYNPYEDETTDYYEIIKKLLEDFIKHAFKELKKLTPAIIKIYLKDYIDEISNINFKRVDVAYFKVMEREEEIEL